MFQENYWPLPVWDKSFNTIVEPQPSQTPDAELEQMITRGWQEVEDTFTRDAPQASLGLPAATPSSIAPLSEAQLSHWQLERPLEGSFGRQRTMRSSTHLNDYMSTQMNLKPVTDLCAPLPLSTTHVPSSTSMGRSISDHTSDTSAISDINSRSNSFSSISSSHGSTYTSG